MHITQRMAALATLALALLMFGAPAQANTSIFVASVTYKHYNLAEGTLAAIVSTLVGDRPWRHLRQQRHTRPELRL